jgi:hypothetical protein
MVSRGFSRLPSHISLFPGLIPGPHVHPFSIPAASFGLTDVRELAPYLLTHECITGIPPDYVLVRAPRTHAHPLQETWPGLSGTHGACAQKEHPT